MGRTRYLIKIYPTLYIKLSMRSLVLPATADTFGKTTTTTGKQKQVADSTYADTQPSQSAYFVLSGHPVGPPWPAEQPRRLRAQHQIGAHLAGL